MKAVLTPPEAPVFKRCAVYARKSTDHGMKDQAFTSIDAQIESCTNYINAHAAEGWLHVATYQDVAISGANLDRPGVQELLGEVRAGSVDIVVIYKLDRLSRSIRDFANLSHEFEQRKVSLVIVTQNFDSATPMGRLCLNFLSSFAEFERSMIRDRILDKSLALAQQGLWNAGLPPFGYRLGEQRRLVPDEKEAEVVKLVFSLAGKGDDPLAIAKKLQALQLAPPRTRKKGADATPWHAAAVRDILKRRLYAGKIAFKGKEYEGQHEAIVTENAWAKADEEIQKAARLNPKKPRQKRDPMAYPLQDILLCPACGEPLRGTYVTSHGRINRYYVCARHTRGAKSCPFKGLPAATVEKAVAGQLASLASDPDVLCALRERLPHLTGRDISAALSNVDMLVDRLSDAALGTLFKALYKTAVVDLEANTLRLERYTA